MVFLPCSKLKYRGILFVEIDFYSDDREEINAKRIAEALAVAHKYRCRKLSCPRNFLYSPYKSESYVNAYVNLNFELEKVVANLPDEVKIGFVVEYVIKKDLNAYSVLSNSWIYYDYSNALVEFLPACAQILPWYKNKIKSINTVYCFSIKSAKLIRKLLTSENLTKKQMFKAFNKLARIMGDYYETAVNCGNLGFEYYLLELCKEMSWNFKILKEMLEDFDKSNAEKKGFAVQSNFGIFT